MKTEGVFFSETGKALSHTAEIDDFLFVCHVKFVTYLQQTHLLVGFCWYLFWG
ncbi:hypothetical protein AXFE_13890 [Acidithrix ferrooxidans]|uniref:Uncharacterized protein n=1 Tax=Acidithrix ferrooxidans TaxID=1280514 RepID=A0A0D8HKU0_9ACTN|nr:hypothetical protein AXFE_13890 [Acidithrix ferrooxidans]